MVGLLERLGDLIRAGEPVALSTVVEVTRAGPTGEADAQSLPQLGAKLLVWRGHPPEGSLGDAGLDAAVAQDALSVVDTGRSSTSRYGARGERNLTDIAVFHEAFVPPDQMIILGAVDFTGALVKIGKVLGYRVTVCDARPSFATTARFPDADEVICDWPHRYLSQIAATLGPRDALCVLTHDHKFDVPALVVALGSKVGYIGAMGSRRTHAGRLERLRLEGASDAELERVMGPIGVDLGARTPEETAVSICAEIIATRSGTAVSSLRDGSGPIHRLSGVSGAGV